MSYAVLIVGTFLVWGAVELWYVAHREPTISERTWSLARAWPPLLFLAGVLAGHLFTH